MTDDTNLIPIHVNLSDKLETSDSQIFQSLSGLFYCCLEPSGNDTAGLGTLWAVATGRVRCLPWFRKNGVSPRDRFTEVL
jgi:hypothetical protein